ncbi:MAG: hypothetical protein IJJ66_02470 [Treponema sp.]|nr:hypothetical protein [Treponema sp.]
MKVTVLRLLLRNALAAIASTLVSFVFLSCSLSQGEKGSLCIKMPGSVSSRAITSTGTLTAPEGTPLENMSFSVYIRNSDNEEVEKFTNIAPGSTLTISELDSGTYNVAIRAIVNYVTVEGAFVDFYGTSEVAVYGGTENTASIRLSDANDCYRCILAFKSESFPSIANITSKMTGSNGDSDEITTGEIVEATYSDTTPFGTTCAGYYEFLYYFFEPGFTYTIEVTFDDGSTEPIHYKGSATATKEGIQFLID